MKSMIESPAHWLGMAFFALMLTSCNDGVEANLATAEFEDAENEAMVSELEECSGNHADFHMAKELGYDICGDWKSKLPECAVVTESGDAYPKTITIEMGDDCEGKHGRKRSGKTVITLSDDMKNEGAVRTVSFQHQGMKGHSVEGVKTLVNVGTNDQDNFVFKRTTEISGTGKRGAFERSSEGYIEWIEGFDTEDCYDNIVSITGTSTTTKEGESVVTREIKEPLIKDANCRYFTQGVVEINGPKGTSVINFGNGACDETATVQKDGVETEIDLGKSRERKKHRRERARE